MCCLQISLILSGNKRTQEKTQKRKNRFSRAPKQKVKESVSLGMLSPIKKKV
jgi:hypothetical protein